MNRPTCSTCPYYEGTLQVCRRHSPRPTTPTVWIEDNQPTVLPIEPNREPDDWCGDHPQFQAGSGLGRALDRIEMPYKLWQMCNMTDLPGGANKATAELVQRQNVEFMADYWRNLGVVGKPNITLCRLGIDSVEKLTEAVATKQLQDLPGVGEVTVRYLEKWIKKHKRQKQGEGT